MALPSTLGLARHRIGILTVLVALPAAVARAQVGEAPPRPIFADSAPGNYVRVPFTAPPATLSKAAALLKAAHANLA